MNSIPARDFLNKYVSAYGAPWEEVFDEMTNSQPCAKHMAEFIDDLERHGQQVPVFVDPDGMVSEGNKVALALSILDKKISFLNSNPPDASDDQVWVVEFETDSGVDEKGLSHLNDYLSFRVEDDWVYPLDAAWEDGETMVLMYCPSGQYTADRLAPIITERLQRMAGVMISGFHVSAYDRVDGEAM